MNLPLLIFTLTAINFIFQVDFVVMMPLGPILMNELQMSAIEFSSAISSYTLMAGFSSLLFSLFGNLFRRKILLSSALILLGVCSLLTGRVESAKELIVVRTMAGFFSGVLNPLIFAIVADAIPEKKRGKALGYIMSGFSLASVLGIPTGLFLSDHYGFQSTFYALAVVFVLVLILSIFILPPDKMRDNTQLNFELIMDFKNAFLNTEYLKGHFLLFFISGAIFIVVPLLSPYAVRNMNIDVENLKHMYFCGGILTVIFLRFVGALCDRMGARKVLAIVATLSIIPVMIFTHASTSSILYFLVLGSLMMALMSGMMVPAMAIASLLPNKKDNRPFNGILNSMRCLGSAQFAFLAGLIVTTVNESQTLVHFDRIGFIYAALIIIVLGISSKMKSSN